MDYLPLSPAPLLFSIIFCPLEFSRVSLQSNAVFSTFAGAEPQDGPIVPDIHLTVALRKLVATEGTWSRSWHLLAPRVLSPEFSGFALCLFQHQNVSYTDWTLHVSGNDPALFSTFQNPDSYLVNFTSSSCTTDYLDHFCRSIFWFFSCRSGTHVSFCLAEARLCDS